MFEELLIPAEEFSFQYFDHAYANWVNKSGLFRIKEYSTGYRWHNEGNPEYNPTNPNDKLYTGREAARQAAIKAVKNKFSVEEWDSKDLGVYRETETSYSIICPKYYPYLSEAEIVHVCGRPGAWDIYVPSMMPEIKTRSTRKQVIEKAHNFLSHNLYNFYDKEEYIKTKDALLCGNGNMLKIEETAWVMFTRPDINLAEIL